MQLMAAFWLYFTVLNDYGIRPATLFGLAVEPGVVPNYTDVYDPSDPFKGNTAAEYAFTEQNSSVSTWTATTKSERVSLMKDYPELQILDWNTNNQINFDIRLFYFW